MKNVAANIREEPAGYLVRVHRPGIGYSAFVAFAGDRAAALRKAIALRDDFKRIHKMSILSNTGHLGICETVKWKSGRPYNCFQAAIGRRAPRYKTRVFRYDNLAQRELALTRAIAWRRNLEAARN